MFALYAFNYEIARVREIVREPMLGQIRLQWWREAVSAAFSGMPPRQHEVVLPLKLGWPRLMDGTAYYPPLDQGNAS